MKMPEYTQRAHATPAWRGDCPAGIRKVGRGLLGKDRIRAADRNFQWAWNDPNNRTKNGGGTAFCMHWGIPKRDNYKYIYDAKLGRVRKMSKSELRRHISQWPAYEVRNWRRTSHVSSDRPNSYKQMARIAVRNDVVMIAELKSRAFGKTWVMEQIVAAAKEVGHEPWFMALLSMAKCRQKCQATELAGGQFAIILGKNRFQRKPADWHHWSPKPTRIWGPKRARKWLED